MSHEHALSCLDEIGGRLVCTKIDKRKRRRDENGIEFLTRLEEGYLGHDIRVALQWASKSLGEGDYKRARKYASEAIRDARRLVRGSGPGYPAGMTARWAKQQIRTAKEIASKIA